MKHKINNDYQVTLANQAVVINKHQDTITLQQATITALNESVSANEKTIKGLEKTIKGLEKQNEGQRYIIAKLNTDARQKEQQIAHLNTTIEHKNRSILSLTDKSIARGDDYKATLDQYKELMTEFRAYKRHKPDQP